MPENSLKQMFDRLATPSTLTESLVILFAVLLGLLAGHFARQWYAGTRYSGAAITNSTA